MADRKQKQMVIAAGILCIILVLFFALYLMMRGGSSNLGIGAGRNPATTVDTTVINNRTDGVTPENEWVEQARQRLRLMEEAQKELENRLNNQGSEYQAELNAREERLREIAEGYEGIIEEQETRIKQLEDRLSDDGSAREQSSANTAPASSPAPGTDNVQLAQPAEQGNGDFVSANGTRRQIATPAVQPAPRNTEFVRSFNLSEPKDAQVSRVRNYQLHAYLPTGSYAPAVVIAGVDASVGVSSQAEPKPVLFRITGPATTAGFGGTSGAQIDLTGCVVAGAAVGDLSSERVHVRLTSMTCQNHDSTVFETTVAGHMVSAGKAGLRGEVVSREGPSIRAAAMAGVLEGIAGAGTNTNNRVLDGLTSGDGADVGAITQNAGRQALTQGAQNAASTLAQYYIERAEQYQPVISVYAGSNVELVFMEGVHLQ